MKARYTASAVGLALMATVGIAAAQTTTATSPSLGVMVSATPVIRPGTGDALLALVVLSAERSNAAIQTSSLPVSMSFGGGLSASALSDCQVRNVNSLSGSLTSAGITASSGVNSFSLNSPLQIDAGRFATLAITCDVSNTAPSGGTVLLSVTPANVQATVVGSSTPVTPTNGFTPNGSLGPTAGSVLISASASQTPGPVIPGVPNTGFGETNNLMVLAASAIAIFLGAMLLRRRLA